MLELSHIIAGFVVLSGAIGHLYAQNVKLGKRLDATNKQLGRMEGAVKSCPVPNCSVAKEFRGLSLLPDKNPSLSES